MKVHALPEVECIKSFDYNFSTCSINRIDSVMPLPSKIFPKDP